MLNRRPDGPAPQTAESYFARRRPLRRNLAKLVGPEIKQ
jgi:hypothetical protein